MQNSHLYTADNSKDKDSAKYKYLNNIVRGINSSIYKYSLVSEVNI